MKEKETWLIIFRNSGEAHKRVVDERFAKWKKETKEVN